MSACVNMEELGRRLESRFGLAIKVESETIDGGIFPTIRPADLARGTGFSIVVARTHRQLEASFRADNFAASLLRRMSEADASARATFGTLVAQTRNAGALVYVGINDNPAEVFPDPNIPWKRVELDVSLRVPSGKLQPDDVFNCAVLATSSCFSMALALLVSEDAGETVPCNEVGLPEGARIRVEVNRYERRPANRAACIVHYGTRCQACDFDFFDAYGKLGEDYIEVHHRTPVSEMGNGYFVNPVLDLVPLCSNCHSMVHRVDPTMRIEDLKAILVARRANRDLVSIDVAYS